MFSRIFKMPFTGNWNRKNDITALIWATGLQGYRATGLQGYRATNTTNHLYPHRYPFVLMGEEKKFW